VTVTIPTFNRAASLRQALRSVLDQSLTDIEVFVSDNASEDDTAEVVAGFRDERIHYVRNDTNIGLHANMSRGLRLGSAPLVCILPDDDRMLPGNLERKVALLEDDPKVGVAHSASLLVHLGADGRQVSENVYWTGGAADHVATGSDALRGLLVGSYWMNFPAAVVRRSIVGETRFDPADELADDYLFAMRVVHNAPRVAYIAEPLVALQMHAEQGSSQLGYHVETKGVFLGGITAHAHLARGRERFLTEFAAELDDVPRLRKEARASTKRRLIETLELTSDHGREPVQAWRGVRDAARVVPEIVLDRQVLGLLAKTLVTTRGRRLLGQVRTRSPRTGVSE
jgi:cellulose synthase/poly-beta-1,6-N-acetylglucosamine synthase-like glycosyltransferase